jgi:hypothetical protein
MMQLLSGFPQDFTQAGWFSFLDPKQQQLVKLSIELWEREEELKSDLFDYSFIVFPMSKAYEGFLKKYLYEQGFLSQHLYKSRKFRIGRALNPDVRVEHRDGDWLYDDVAHVCGRDVARNLWNVWLKSRNQIFHYFPDSTNVLSLSDVAEHLLEIMTAMDEAVSCKLSPQSAPN